MRFLLYIALTLCFPLISQTENSLLISRGEIPEFINQQSAFIERVPLKTEIDAMDNFKHIDIILEQVLNSGKVVFGEEICNFMQIIANNLTKNELSVKVYLIKTNKVLTFSTNEGSLFVSTGLISQVSNESQLAYFIAREIEIITTKVNKLPKKKMVTQSYEDKIELLATHDENITRKIDSLGAIRYLQSNYAPSEILNSFDVIKYAYMPFEQLNFPVDYFNTDQFFVPNEFFDVYGEMGEIPLNNSSMFVELESKIESRKKRLESIFNLKMNETMASNSNEFIKIRNTCRIESIRQDIINGKFNDAIYNIFVLETFYKNPYLDKLKAHAWLGLAAQESGSSKRWEKLKYQDVQGESSKFLFTLRKLNANGVAGFSIRILYDLKEKYKSQEFDLIWKNLMATLKASEFFQYEKFSPNSYHAALEFYSGKQNTSDSLDNKYDKINNIKKNSTTDKFDINEFYLYGISDLIVDSTLIKELNKNQLLQEKSIQENSTVLIHPFIQFRKNSGKFNSTKSEKFRKHFASKTSQLPTGLKLTCDTTEMDYFHFSILKETLSQTFVNSDYKNKLLPLYNIELKSYSGDFDYTSFTFFESYYRPKLKPYHWISLTVIALPAMIPDIFLKSFQTKHFNLIVNSNTGEIISSNYSKYFEPLTKRLMKNRVFYSLPNTNSK